MTNDELLEFCRLWAAANDYYQEKCKPNHMAFPEPILKDLIKNKFSLTDVNPEPYDFDDKIELKSATKINGNTPYQFSESKCERVIYCEITDNKIYMYEIAKKKVATIRGKIRKAKKDYSTKVKKHHLQTL